MLTSKELYRKQPFLIGKRAIFQLKFWQNFIQIEAFFFAQLRLLVKNCEANNSNI
jgi:hypothetical protein